MKKIILLISFFVAIVSSNAQTLDKTLLFDFGPNDITNGNITTNPDINGSYWNNITNPASSATVSNLINKTSTTTSYGLQITSKFSTNGILNGGLLAPEVSKLGIFAIPTATQDYFYSTTSGSFKLTGLVKTKGYKFYFFSSRSTSDPARITKFIYTGLNSSEGTLQSSGTNIGGTGKNGNNSTVLESIYIYPDANSEINVNVSAYSGGYAYINAMKVEEYTIPYVTTTAINVIGNDITAAGGKSQMSITLVPGDATPNTVSWSVDNTSVASIDATGLLSPKRNGVVNVIASITQSGVMLSGQKQISITNQLSELYLSGTATTNGDNVATAISLNTPPDQVGSNSGIFELYTTLKTTGTFNFYSSKNISTATVYGSGTTQDTLIVGGSGITSTISGPALIRAYLGTGKYKIYPVDSLRISQMGSSVSNGQGATEIVINSLGATSYKGYAYQYGQLLKQRYIDGLGQNWVLSNISVGGNDTKDVLARWDKDLLNDGSLYVVYGLSLGNEGITTGGQAIYDQFKNNMLLLIDKARSVGKIPIVSNVYPRGDFGLTEYNYVKQMDMLIHEWDVPSINLLGCIDDSTGKWPLLYQHDISHPNDAGHTELSYGIVPSLFDALKAGKPQPQKQSGTYLSFNRTTANRQLVFTPDNTIHSFTQSVDFKTTGHGVITSFLQNSSYGNIAIDSTSGYLSYQSPNGGYISKQAIINNGQWHNVTLTHYYAMGFTVLYIDGVEAGRLGEKLVATTFYLFDANAPASVDYRNWFFYRSGMNALEVTGLNNGKMLKSSLELYAPLDGQAILSSNPLVNLAQSTNIIQSIDNSKTVQTITFPTLPTKTVGDADFIAGATSSSGLTVSLISSNISVATIVGGNIHIAGAGTSFITASQTGNATYNAAINVRQKLTVNGTSQTITFPPLSAKVVGDADFSAGATASSGLTVSLASSNTAVATIAGGNIHIIGAGTAVITASQDGNAVYNSATNVTQTLVVTAAPVSGGLCNETFDYTVGPLAGQGSWTEAGTFTAGSGTRTIGLGALTYSDAGGSYILSGAGKSMTVSILSGSTASDFKAYKPFSATSINSGVLYLSFLLKVNANVSSTNQEAFGLADGTSAGPKVLVGKTTTGFYKIGTVRGSTASGDYKYAATPTSLTVGSTYLIVLKYNFSTSTSSVYINPTLGGTEPANPEISDNTSATIRTKLSNLWSRAQGVVVQNLSIGGVRVSTTWAEAVATTAPVEAVQLDAPLSGSATNITTTGFTANWTPMDFNATGYYVKVYWGSILYSTTSVSGQSTSYKDITGLITGLSYTYKVIAVGNGTTYTDSDTSASSEIFTLLQGTVPANGLKIILKLDDLGVLNNVCQALPSMNHLISKQIKAGYGAIANRLDGTSLGVLSSYLGSQNSQGDTLFEVWNHGLLHVDPEFQTTDYAYQKSHFDQATQLVKQYLGVQMHTFGTPYNHSDATTNTVVSEDPNYKGFFFNSVPTNAMGFISLNNRVNMESATGNPEFAYFVANYNNYKSTYKDYMVLQGHPNYYTGPVLEQFKLIIEFLLSEGCTFVKPYEYYTLLPISNSQTPSTGQNNNLGFGTTNILLDLFVSAPATISTLFYEHTAPQTGTLPSGIIRVSKYYWTFSAPGISFNNGYIKIPISLLGGVINSANLVWLKRTNPGDAWTNIGGTIIGENLVSTSPFTSFSEFAIGTSGGDPLPVELSSFVSIPSGRTIRLTWETKTEKNSDKFVIERKAITDNWGVIGSVKASVLSNSPKQYSFIDKDLQAGKYQYRLKMIDNGGTFEYSKAIEVDIAVPKEYSVSQNFPNPFNPSTTIKYQIPRPGLVTMKVFNPLGREVTTLVNENKTEGFYEVNFDASKLPSGIYIYQLKANDFVSSKKMILIK